MLESKQPNAGNSAAGAGQLPDPALLAATEQSGLVVRPPDAQRPWEDRSLTSEQRIEAYTAVVVEKLQGIDAAYARAGDDQYSKKAVRESPDTVHWLNEGRWLEGATPEEFCRRFDRFDLVRNLLGPNFLGREAWRAQGVHVGSTPPLPEFITVDLLESKCPFDPGKKSKDTHVLVLIPKTVNGEPYSALTLDELCYTRRGVEEQLISRAEENGPFQQEVWRTRPWASVEQLESEWVLVAKWGPKSAKVGEEKYFLNKNVAGQQKVLSEHYKEYRVVKVVELATAMVLNELVNREPFAPGTRDAWRCAEENANGRFMVSGFHGHHLTITDMDTDGQAVSNFGLGLVRRS